LPVPTFTEPVVPESSVAEPVDPEVKERLVPLPVVILPAPTKPKAVALVLMVSREETPVRAPPVETFKPPLLINWKVPPEAELPMMVADPAVEDRVVAPVDESVVKAAVPGVVAPMFVPLIPVLVVLKYSELIVNALEPVEIEDALRPESARLPLVAVRLSAPDERVKPLEAVSNWLIVAEPLMAVPTLACPMVIPVALAVPILIVPPVPPDAVAAPASRTNEPPVLLVPVSFPAWKVRFPPFAVLVVLFAG
jgi:hypothetical protein